MTAKGSRIPISKTSNMGRQKENSPQAPKTGELHSFGDKSWHSLGQIRYDSTHTYVHTNMRMYSTKPRVRMYSALYAHVYVHVHYVRTYQLLGSPFISVPWFVKVSGVLCIHIRMYNCLSL